ncbi:MAG: hypothetical protein AAF182_00920 [Pseudomonadota bacterium]
MKNPNYIPHNNPRGLLSLSKGFLDSMTNAENALAKEEGGRALAFAKDKFTFV